MSATSARKQVIKLANKINLRRVGISTGHRLSFLLVGMIAASLLPLLSQSAAQVPPRPGVVGQRDKEKPRKDEPIEWVTTTYDTFSLTPWCTLTFLGKDGKEAVLDFCGEKLTYSGDLEVDEAAKLFFEHVFKHIVACESRTKEQREE